MSNFVGNSPNCLPEWLEPPLSHQQCSSCSPFSSALGVVCLGACLPLASTPHYSPRPADAAYLPRLSPPLWPTSQVCLRSAARGRWDLGTQKLSGSTVLETWPGMEFQMQPCNSVKQRWGLFRIPVFSRAKNFVLLILMVTFYLVSSMSPSWRDLSC